MEGPFRLLLLLALVLAGAVAAHAEEDPTFAGAAHAREELAFAGAVAGDTSSSSTATTHVREEKGATEASIKGAAGSSSSTTAGAGAGPTKTSGMGPEEPAGTTTATTNCGDDSMSEVAVAVKPRPSLAMEVALFCRRGLHPAPAARCCEPVRCYVNRIGICRVSNDPQLVVARINSSRLLDLYNACGGQSALVAAACQGKSQPAVPVNAMARPPYRFNFSDGGETTCDSSSLAVELTEQCNIDKTVASRSCCTAVLKAIDVEDEACLCNVIDDGWFALSRLDIRYMWKTYTQCGGKKEAVPKDITRCDHAPSPPPSPSPPASPPPPPEGKPHRGLPALVIAAVVVGAILLISAVVAAALALYRKLKTAEVGAVPLPPPAIQLANLPRQPASGSPRINLPQDPARDAAAIRLPQEPAPEDDQAEQARSEPSLSGELDLVPPAARPPATGPLPPLPQVIKPPPPPVLILVQ